MVDCRLIVLACQSKIGCRAAAMLFTFWGGYHCRRGFHVPHNASMASFRGWLLCSRSVSGRGGRCVTIAAVASIPAFQGVSTPDADESRSLATSHLTMITQAAYPRLPKSSSNVASASSCGASAHPYRVPARVRPIATGQWRRSSRSLDQQHGSKRSRRARWLMGRERAAIEWLCTYIFVCARKLNKGGMCTCTVCTR